MTRLVLLDTGPLGMVTHPRRNQAAKDWLRDLLRSGTEARVPEIVDYEIRRELLRVNATTGIMRLDALSRSIGYVSLSTVTMRRAAELWASARREGRPTAGPDSLA